MGNALVIGRIVHYTLNEQDAAEINRRRRDSSGVVVHVGNQVQAGDTFPMVITRVWGDTPESAVNGQVLLDGNDTYWATSRSVGDGEGRFAWPVIGG